jgi:hypothetical protein
VSKGPAKTVNPQYPYEMKINLTKVMHDLMDIASRKYHIKKAVLGRLAIIEYLSRNFPDYKGE